MTFVDSASWTYLRLSDLYILVLFGKLQTEKMHLTANNVYRIKMHRILHMLKTLTLFNHLKISRVAYCTELHRNKAIHDVSFFKNPLPVFNREGTIGFPFVRPSFSQSVSPPVRQSVRANRWALVGY